MRRKKHKSGHNPNTTAMTESSTAVASRSKRPLTRASYQSQRQFALLSLPNEILAMVAKSLPPFESIIAALTCRQLYNLTLQLSAVQSLASLFPRPWRYRKTLNHYLGYKPAEDPQIRETIRLIGYVKDMAGSSWKYCCVFEIDVDGKRHWGHGCHLVPTSKDRDCRCTCFVCAGTINSIRQCGLDPTEKLQLWEERRSLEAELSKKV